MSSDQAQQFVQYLGRLQDTNRAALAILRRSLSFESGAYPPAYPLVERFVPRDCSARDSRRKSLYLVAGLYAQHPKHGSKSLASAFGELMRQRGSDSIEKRFIALLGADAENLGVYLRQVVSLLAADDIPFDYGLLQDDLRLWLNADADHDWLDNLRQRWARDFYRTFSNGQIETIDNT
jgi:CRISPR system Cascade subunit CasB